MGRITKTEALDPFCIIIYICVRALAISAMSSIEKR